MAWNFDGTNDNVTLANHALLDLPDGDWTIAVILKLSSTTGWPNDRGVFYREDSGGQGAIEVEIDQTAGSANYQKLEIYDDSFANEVALNSNPTAPWSGNTNWTQLIVKRASSNYIVKVAGSTVLSNGLNSVELGEDWTGVFEIGATGGNEFFHGQMAEMACWFRSLSDAEEAALWNGSRGFAPSFFRDSLQWYLPMIRDYVEVKAGIAVTNNGTTIADHPAIIYPSSPYIIRVPAAGETHEFAGSETISFDGTAALVQSATFSDSQTVSFDGQAAMIQTATFTGAEEVSFDGTADTIRNHWSFADSQAVSFDGQAALQQEAVFTGEETVSFDGQAALKQTANLTGAETVSFDGEAALDIAALIFEGQGLLSFDGSIATLNAILQMEAAQSVSFDGQAALGQQALFEGGATLSFDGLADLEAFQWDAVDTPAAVTWSDVD